MSLRDELKNRLDEAGVPYSNLVVDKDADHHGRPATKVGFIINGVKGPVFFDTTLADDLKLTNEEQAKLIAINAVKAYANYSWHDRETE